MQRSAILKRFKNEFELARSHPLTTTLPCVSENILFKSKKQVIPRRQHEIDISVKIAVTDGDCSVSLFILSNAEKCPQVAHTFTFCFKEHIVHIAFQDRREEFETEYLSKNMFTPILIKEMRL